MANADQTVRVEIVLEDQDALKLLQRCIVFCDAVTSREGLPGDIHETAEQLSQDLSAQITEILEEMRPKSARPQTPAVNLPASN